MRAMRRVMAAVVVLCGGLLPRIPDAQLTTSAIAPATSQSTDCRTTIVGVTAGSAVPLQLYGLLGAVTLVAPGGAELVIEKLSP